MYPKNAASPERVDIGPVVLIADGTVQTSGVSVKVIPQGGAEASGGGTIAYSADGIVLYTPTQAETNYTSFVLIATKSGCIPASKTIVTTAESTPGTVKANTYQWGGTAVASASVRSDLISILGTALTETVGGYLAAAFKKFLDVAAPVFTAASVNQTGDAFARIGNNGAGLTGLGDTRLANLDVALSTIAGYIDTEVAAIKAKTDNLPPDPADASDIAAAFATVNSTLATIAGYIDTEVAAIKAKTDNLPASPASETTLSALSAKLAGITLLKNWLALIMGKAADNTTKAEVNATTAGATYDQATDSLEAQKDAGGGGGGTGDWTSNEKTAIRSILGIPASGTTPDSPTSGILSSISQALSGSAITVSGRVASGGTITAYIGDDFKVRSGTQLAISTTDVGGALYTKWTAIGASHLFFGASREGTDVGAIAGTIASITSVGSGASQTCKLTVEITNCGSGLKPGTYDYQIEQRQTQGSDVDSFIEVSGSLILKRNSVA